MTHTDPQYDTLIDAQTWEFIKQTEKWYPADTIDFSMQTQRTVYDTMCREFHTGYPNGISAADDTIETNDCNIPVRRYTSADSNNTALLSHRS